MGSERMHPQACVASYGAHCAGKQGKFWEMHDKLFGKQKSLNRDTFLKIAGEIGLDVAKLKIKANYVVSILRTFYPLRGHSVPVRAGGVPLR